MGNYYGQKNAKRGNQGSFRVLFWAALAFLIGYLSASYHHIERAGTWLNAHLLGHPNASTSPAQSAQTAELPKPKFEFYTLLTSDAPTGASRLATVPTLSSQTVRVALPASATKPVAQALANSNKRAYLIQVAAFRRRNDAERVRASLIMKGFDVHIAAVKQQNLDWYRVVIGPFNSREQAEKAQMMIVKSERMKGMIRAMDG